MDQRFRASARGTAVARQARTRTLVRARARARTLARTWVRARSSTGSICRPSPTPILAPAHSKFVCIWFKVLIF